MLMRFLASRLNEGEKASPRRRASHRVWDGNTNSPVARNLLASLGLGAPIHGKRGELDFMVKRPTDLSEKIAAPRYPFPINETSAKRGAPLFEANCNSCHGGAESDKRLYSIAEVKTDPHRTERRGVRSTGKYSTATLNGVWALAVTAEERSETSSGTWTVEGKVLKLIFGENEVVRPFTFHEGQLVFPNVPSGRKFWDRMQ